MQFRPITLRAANDFVERHHRHSSRTANDGGKFALALVDGGELVGVAIVGRPVARLLQDEFTAEVLRVCVIPGAPMGACSKLYAQCNRIWRLMGGKRVVTYTLKRESGASLRGAGWHIAAEVAERPSGRQWDRKTRARPFADICNQPRFRWECDAA